MFVNRQQAGALLAQEISNFFNRSKEINQNQIVIFALPRGGVPVALEISLALHCPLNVIASKKIGAPEQKELAVGAVTSSGVVVVDEALTDHLNISADYINKEKQYLVNKTKQLEERWCQSAGLEKQLDIDHKIAIVVDDGVATGMTAIAAARSLKRRGAGKIILATPVISPAAFNRLLQEYNDVIALQTPSDFVSVGQFYLDFHQVEDIEVVQALVQANNNNCVKLV